MGSHFKHSKSAVRGTPKASTCTQPSQDPGQKMAPTRILAKQDPGCNWNWAQKWRTLPGSCTGSGQDPRILGALLESIMMTNDKMAPLWAPKAMWAMDSHSKQQNTHLGAPQCPTRPQIGIFELGSVPKHPLFFRIFSVCRF